MHRETGAYHKKFLGHNQKWLTMFFEYLYKFYKPFLIKSLYITFDYVPSDKYGV